MEKSSFLDRDRDRCHVTDRRDRTARLEMIRSRVRTIGVSVKNLNDFGSSYAEDRSDFTACRVSILSEKSIQRTGRSDKISHIT